MRSDVNSDTFRRGWNCALNSVVRCLPELAEKIRLSAADHGAVATVGVLCEAMIIPGRTSPLRNRSLAMKYGVSIRTITNWRREKCPFERGQSAVLKWVASRRYAPPAMEVKYRDRLLKWRLRKYSSELQETLTVMRRLKCVRRIYRLTPDSIDHQIRSPKGTITNAGVLALISQIEGSNAVGTLL